MAPLSSWAPPLHPSILPACPPSPVGDLRDLPDTTQLSVTPDLAVMDSVLNEIYISDDGRPPAVVRLSGEEMYEIFWEKMEWKFPSTLGDNLNHRITIRPNSPGIGSRFIMSTTTWCLVSFHKRCCIRL